MRSVDLLVGYLSSLHALAVKTPSYFTSNFCPKTIFRLFFTLSLLPTRLQATGESPMTTGNTGCIHRKQGSPEPSSIYRNGRRCIHKCVQGSIPFQEALLSVLLGIHTTIEVAVDGKNMLQGITHMSSEHILKLERSVRTLLYWKQQSTNPTQGKESFSFIS